MTDETQRPLKGGKYFEIASSTIDFQTVFFKLEERKHWTTKQTCTIDLGTCTPTMRTTLRYKWSRLFTTTKKQVKTEIDMFLCPENTHQRRWLTGFVPSKSRLLA